MKVEFIRAFKDAFLLYSELDSTFKNLTQVRACQYKDLSVKSPQNMQINQRLLLLSCF